jgi:multiple sugar transport system permease protein
MTQSSIKIKRFTKRNTYRSKARTEKIVNILSLLLIILTAAAVLLPIWWMFRTSLMNTTELYQFPPAFVPKNWRFSNYHDTMKNFPFWLYLKNTMTIIIPSIIGGVTTATLAGYAFARLNFKGKNVIFTLCVGSMLLPSMVTLIPLYTAWTRVLGVHDSYLPLILPQFCGGGAFNIFLIRQFIKTIPKELDEAAKIDGASPMRILWSIIVPAIKPAMIVVGLLLFIMLWNDMLQQLVYINSPDKYTIAIGMGNFRSAYKVDWSQVMAATCMSFAPGVLFYLVGQKYFVEGITMTGMKN